MPKLLSAVQSWPPVRGLMRLIERYAKAQGPNWAIIVAWNAFFAFFPMILLAVSLVGLLLQDPGTRQTIISQAVAVFPQCRTGKCPAIDALQSFRHQGGIFAIVGFAGLIWTGSGFFGAIDQALNAFCSCRARDFIPEKLMSIMMVFVFTILAIPLVLSGSALSLLHSVPILPEVFKSGPVSLVVHLVAGTIDATFLFWLVYLVVPNRKQSWRAPLPGAIFAGFTFECLSLLLPLYFGLVSSSPQWGQTFGFVFLLLFYFSLLGNILVLGAALNAELESRRPSAAAAQPT